MTVAPPKFVVRSLPFLASGTRAEANAISDDGTVIVGESNIVASGALHAFRWTAQGGSVNLGLLSGGTYSAALGVSGDGSVVVGVADITAGAQRAFLWSAGTGIESMGVLPGGSYSQANAVSYDGTVVVGYADNSDGEKHAFRWTSAGGMVDMGVLATGVFSEALGVNYDGSVIVGSSTVGGIDVYHSFWWSAASGMVDIGAIALGSFSEARAVSADGSVVVGRSSKTNGGVTFPYRWTLAGGMVSLGTVPSGIGGAAFGMDRLGVIVTGIAFDSLSNFVPFRWTEAAGLTALPLINALADHGEANGSSGDGLTYVGESNAAAVGSDVGDHATVWTIPSFPKFPHPTTTTFEPPAFDVLQMVTARSAWPYDPYWIERTTRLYDVDSTLEDAWFLDSAVQATAVVDVAGTGVKLYGLWHLRNASGISAWIAGLDCGEYTVAADGTLFVPYLSDPDGNFTKAVFDASKKIAVVGYSYTSQGQILRAATAVEAGAVNGPPLAKTRRGHQFGVLLDSTVGVSFGTDFTTVRVAQFKSKGGTLYNKSQPFSGVYQNTLEDTYSYDSMLCWQVTRPYPVTIAAIGNFLSTQDR